MSGFEVVSATLRFGRSTGTGLLLVGVFVLGVIASLVSWIGASPATVIGLLGLTGLLLAWWSWEKRRGTWTVSIYPDGTILSVLRSVRTPVSLVETLNLREVDAAETDLSAVRVGHGAVHTSMDLLTLRAGEQMVRVPVSALRNDALLKRLRSFTRHNSRLAEADLPLATRVILRPHSPRSGVHA